MTTIQDIQAAAEVFSNSVTAKPALRPIKTAMISSSPLGSEAVTGTCSRTSGSPGRARSPSLYRGPFGRPSAGNNTPMATLTVQQAPMVREGCSKPDTPYFRRSLFDSAMNSPTGSAASSSSPIAALGVDVPAPIRTRTASAAVEPRKSANVSLVPTKWLSSKWLLKQKAGLSPMETPQDWTRRQQDPHSGLETYTKTSPAKKTSEFIKLLCNTFVKLWFYAQCSGKPDKAADVSGLRIQIPVDVECPAAAGASSAAVSPDGNAVDYSDLASEASPRLEPKGQFDYHKWASKKYTARCPSLLLACKQESMLSSLCP